MIVNAIADEDGYTKICNHRKTLRKPLEKCKKNNQLKTKRVLNTK